MTDWEAELRIAQTAFGWRPAEFWAASRYEFETALLARLREVEPEPWSDDATIAHFDRMPGFVLDAPGDSPAGSRPPGAKG